MAYDFYDGVNPYTGQPETEEERRKRLGVVAPNDVVQSTETKTYGDGSQEQITKQQIPAQPAAPVAPADFQRIQQIESGGKDYTAAGQPVTSPKGALFASQVMPATAASPGFGVKPAQAQTPEEYNRVGQDYFNAMLQRYGGDRAKAAAAYNAGPGAVDKNIAANAGQMNVQQLPQETQGYLQKFLGGVGNVVNAVIPSAQAGELTPEIRQKQALAQRDAIAAQQKPTVTQPAAPTAVAPTEQPMLGGGLRAPMNLGGANLPSTTGQVGGDSSVWINQYQTAQDDPAALLALRKNENAPQWMRERAGNRAYELLNAENQKATAEKQAQQLFAGAASGDRKASLEIGRALQNQEGSYLKMLLLGFISPDLAGQEAAKLGFGAKWASAYDAQGNQALVKTRLDGMPMEGYKADGTPLTRNELLAFATGGGLGKGTSVSAEVYVDQNTGKRYRSGVDQSGRAALIDIQGGGRFTGDPKNLQVQSVGTAAAKADYQMITDLRKKHGTNVLDAEKDYISLNGPFKSDSERNQFRQAYGLTGGMPNIGAAPAPGAAPAGGVTAVAPSAVSTTQAQPALGAAPAAGGVTAVAPTGSISKPLAQQQAEHKGAELTIADRVKSNQVFSDELAKSRSASAAQSATIERLQSAINKNPAFWGIDTNSTIWRAYVDANSTNADRAEALNTLARNLNIPNNKRAEFDQVMNDYRSLQLNAITASGLTASQTNTERESQRVVGTVGSLADKPAAAKATLEYAKAKLEYLDEKAKAWATARKNNPGVDRLDFESNFDATKGEDIFKRANERMNKIIGGQGATQEGQTATSKSGKPIVFRNGRWEYQ